MNLVSKGCLFDEFLLKLKLGKKPEEIVKEFMLNWDTKKDGVIMWDEFLDHYRVKQ